MNETEARSRKAHALARAWETTGLPARELENMLALAAGSSHRAKQAQTALRLTCGLASKQSPDPHRRSMPWDRASAETWALVVQLLKENEHAEQLAAYSAITDRTGE